MDPKIRNPKRLNAEPQLDVEMSSLDTMNASTFQSSQHGIALNAKSQDPEVPQRTPQSCVPTLSLYTSAHPEWILRFCVCAVRSKQHVSGLRRCADLGSLSGGEASLSPLFDKPLTLNPKP